MIKRSRNVADGMSKGIQFLMKKNKIDVIMGTATVKAGKKVEVKAADGKVGAPLKLNISLLQLELAHVCYQIYEW